MDRRDHRVRCSREEAINEVRAGYRLGLGVPSRPRTMPEVTYYVALPFVSSDDGIAPGEAVECFNPNAAVMRAEAFAKRRIRRRGRIQPLRRSRYR
jgi:hypothetical protein